MKDSPPTYSPLAARFYVSDAAHLLKRHCPLLFLVPLLLLGGVVAYHFVGTKYFSASASVYMDPSFGNRIQTESTTAANGMASDEEALFSMEETICSEAMILRVLTKLGLLYDQEFLPKSITRRIDKGKDVTESRIVNAVRKRYGAELINATRILKVHVEDPDADRAVKIAETFISEFVLFLQEQKVQSEIDLKENLLAQAEQIKQRAIAAEKDLNKFRNKNDDFLVEQDSDLFSQKMLDASTELNSTNAELIRVTALLNALNQINPAENPIRILNLASGEYAINYDEVIAQRNDALVRLEDIRQRYGPSHSDYRAAYNQFRSIDQTIQNNAKELKASTQSRYDLLSTQKTTLESEMEKLRAGFKQYKSASAEFRGLDGSVERDWALYNKINQRILSLTDQAELSPNLATPLGEPIVPFKPSKKRIITASAAGVLLSMGWIVVIAAILILKGLPFTNSRQIQDVLGVPMAATLNKRDISDPEVLASLPLLTGSSKVLHLTAADQRQSGDQNVCQMITSAYRTQGMQVTVVQVSDIPGKHQYVFNDEGVDSFEVSPAQIEVRKLRLKIREFLNNDPNRTVIIDSSGLKNSETKLALGCITNSTVVLIRENGITREEAHSWISRFKGQSGNIMVLYQSQNFPKKPGLSKALPMKQKTPTPAAASLGTTA